MIRFGLGVVFLVATAGRGAGPGQACAGQARRQAGKPAAEEGRQPRKNTPNTSSKPETVPDYWEAIQFELEVGKPNIAARPAPPDDEERDQRQGTGRPGAEGRHRRLPAAPDQLPPLHDSRTGQRREGGPEAHGAGLEGREGTVRPRQQGARTVLGNPQPILKHIKELNGDREDRKFAAGKLYEVRALAVPILVAELQSAKGESATPSRRCCRCCTPRRCRHSSPPSTSTTPTCAST